MLIFDPVTTNSSISAATEDAKLKFNLSVSPIISVVITSWLVNPGADTTIVYGPPGLNPPALNLPFEPVTLVTTVLVGSYVIVTCAPSTDPASELTEPVRSDVSSCENANGERNNERIEILSKFRIIFISSN